MSARMTATAGPAERESERNINQPTVTTRASQPQPPQEFMHEDIAKLAYALWQQRGCPHGSAEFDWFAAEGTLLESVERSVSAAKGG
ncbi:MAG: DUF2934 domain-containing protein [Bryobacteraceae bacterium]